MRKSEKYSVAIFLAVALFAGTIAGSSAPAFVVDAQATEEKKDYKEKDRNYDKDYRHDDNKRYGDENKYGDDGRDKYSKDRDDKYGQDDYGKDRDDKYGQEEQYSKYGEDRHDDYGKDRDDKYGHDEKSSVKYIKCNNVNINGKDRDHNGGNDNWPRNGGNDWPRNGGNDWRNGGEENGYNHDSFMKRDNHNFPGFIKQTDKDVVVICIFNNDKKNKEPKTPEEKCDACIRDLPGLSPGQNPNQVNGTGLERQFVEYIIDLYSDPMEDPLTPAEAIAAFCEDVLSGEFSDAELLMLITDALTASENSDPVMDLFDCLSELLGSEGPPVP
jgi:hypothetical protein